MGTHFPLLYQHDPPGWMLEWKKHHMWDSIDSEVCLNIYCHLHTLTEDKILLVSNMCKNCSKESGLL